MQRTFFFFGLTVKTNMDQVQGLVFCLGAVQVLLLIVAAILAQIRPATQNDVFLKNDDKYDFRDGRLIVLENERVVELKESQQSPDQIIGFLQTINGIIGVITFAVFRKCFPIDMRNSSQNQYFAFLIGSITIALLGLITLITGALNRLDLWNLYVLNPEQTVGITASSVRMNVSVTATGPQTGLLSFNVIQGPEGVSMESTDPQSLPLGFRYEFKLDNFGADKTTFNVGQLQGGVLQMSQTTAPSLLPDQQPYVTRSSDGNTLFVDVDNLGLVSGEVLYAYYRSSAANAQAAYTTYKFLIVNPDAVDKESVNNPVR